MKILFSFVFFSILFLSSCSENSSSQDGSQTASKNEAVISFRCQKATNWTEETPQHEAHLMIDKQDILVAIINTCEAISTDLYEQYEIPVNAIAACGGWWAGAGDYLYVVKEDEDINVYKGSQFEEQTEPGFGYEKIRTVSPED